MDWHLPKQKSPHVAVAHLKCGGFESLCIVKCKIHTEIGNHFKKNVKVIANILYWLSVATIFGLYWT